MFLTVLSVIHKYSAPDLCLNANPINTEKQTSLDPCHRWVRSAAAQVGRKLTAEMCSQESTKVLCMRGRINKAGSSGGTSWAGWTGSWVFSPHRHIKLNCWVLNSSFFTFLQFQLKINQKQHRRAVLMLKILFVTLNTEAISRKGSQFCVKRKKMTFFFAFEWLTLLIYSLMNNHSCWLQVLYQFYFSAFQLVSLVLWEMPGLPHICIRHESQCSFFFY